MEQGPRAAVAVSSATQHEHTGRRLHTSHHPHPPEMLWPTDEPAAASAVTAGGGGRRPRPRPAEPRYRELGKVGEGAFGEVAVAIDRLGGGFVAVKSVRLGGGDSLEKDGLPRAALRELRALRAAEHEHVLRLLDAYPKGPSLALVLEYMPSDLDLVIRHSRRPLGEAEVKAFTWMTLQGVGFLHSRGILHRDLKPSNLLLSARGVLKIGDLGSARVHTEPQRASYSHQVATRWYRAPELLLGARRYGPAVDLWAVGAIFGELASLSPLFPGTNDVDQLFRVAQVLGAPTPARWPAVVDLPDYDKIVFPDTPPVDLHVAFPRVPRAAIPLLGKLLALDPARRPSAAEALAHEYFFLAPLPCDPSELPIVSRPLPGVVAAAAAAAAAKGKGKGSGLGAGRRRGVVSGWSSSSEEEGDEERMMVEG